MRDECSKFGTVVDLKVPRPVGGSRQSAGVGKIYVKFDSKDSATKALQALAGRKFADRTVVTTYFPEVSSWSYIRQNTTLTHDSRRTSTSVPGNGLSLLDEAIFGDM